MKKYNYFETPTQVKFWDRYYISGIAYRDEIICGRCGSVLDISSIYEFAPDTLEEDPITPYDNWVDISHEICGDGN